MHILLTVDEFFTNMHFIADGLVSSQTQWELLLYSQLQYLQYQLEDPSQVDQWVSRLTSQCRWAFVLLSAMWNSWSSMHHHALLPLGFWSYVELPVSYIHHQYSSKDKMGAIEVQPIIYTFPYIKSCRLCVPNTILVSMTC